MNEIQKYLKTLEGKTCGHNDTWYINPCKGKIKIVSFKDNPSNFPLECTVCKNNFYTPHWLELIGGWTKIEEMCKESSI